MCACLCVWLCLFILCFVSLKWTNPPGSNKWVLTLFRVSNNVTTTYLFNRIYVLCLKVDSVFMLKVLLLFLLFYLYWYSDSPSFVSFLEFIVTAWLLFEKVGIMCDQKLKVVLIFWISPEWWDQWFSLVHFQSSLPSRSSMCKSRIRFSSARNWQRALAITKKNNKSRRRRNGHYFWHSKTAESACEQTFSAKSMGVCWKVEIVGTVERFFIFTVKCLLIICFLCSILKTWYENKN